LLVALSLVLSGWAANRFAGVHDPYLFWVLGQIPFLMALPSFSAFVEVSMFPALYLIVGAFVPLTGAWISLPFVVTLLVVAAHPLASRLAPVLATIGTVLWLDIPGLVAPPFQGWVPTALLAAGVVGLVPYLLATGRREAPVRTIDLLVCSYTGNTAHYAQTFGRAAAEVGAVVTEHRFHYHKDFQASFEGEALVVAYGVAGWGPYWPVFEYLLFKLPRGKGKPAFLLHTSGGGPENSHLVPWLALWLRGYRVLGRLGAMYPINVPVMRPTSRLMRFVDMLVPRPSDLRLHENAARAFALGRRAGWGLTVFPFVLFIAGPLTYNRFINYIYRSYSFKRLCNDCMRCINFCPTERLYMKNGRVRSKGPCALCFGCVSVCPTESVQLALVTELGNAYRARWPKLLVRRKPKAAGQTQRTPSR
jgi:ferredoxin